MRIGEAVDFYVRALPKGKIVLDTGKPGVGKTYARREACRILQWEYIGICAPLQSPVKIGGYPRAPMVEGGDATHALFDGIARAFRATGPTHLHIDDLGMANGETLKSIVDLIQWGRIDNRTLPESVVVGASSNDIGHGADVQGLIEPLKSRFDTILEIETNLDDVVRWGLSQGWPADLCGYLRNAPEALHDWKPCKNMRIDGACPRGWDHVAAWVNDGFDDPEIISGCVGKGRATEYLAFRALVNDLPDIDALLLDPDSAPVPENPSARFLISMTLASRMTGSNFGACVKYLNKLPAMFRAFSIRDAVKSEAAKRRDGKLGKDHKMIHTSRDYCAWATSKEGGDILSAAG